MKKILITLFFALLSNFSYSKVLLWDMGGVLFHPNKFGVAQSVGLSYFLSYLLFDMRNPNIESVLFDVLNQIERPPKGFQSVPGTAEGKPLPYLMCKWQAGLIDGPDLIKKALAHIKTLKSTDYFESDREYRLIKRTIKAIFDPSTLANNVYEVQAGLQLVEECARAKNKDGTKKNRNFVFSNWDRLSFQVFYKRNRYMFRDFEKIVISGDIGHVKPAKSAYEYLLKTHNLNAKDCILIDDQKINILGAQACGIKTILIVDDDYEHIRNQLKNMGAL